MQDYRYYLPGGLLILLALLILAFPEILVAFVAAFMIMAGAAALYLGHRLKGAERRLDGLRDWVAGEDPGSGWGRGMSFRREWHCDR